MLSMQRIYNKTKKYVTADSQQLTWPQQ